MTGLWLKGLLLRRYGRLLGAVIGVALTIAMLISLGDFLVVSSATMTERAIAMVPVDWQVRLAPDMAISKAVDAVGKAVAYTALQEVDYADVEGFEATLGGTTQTTGTGKVLGIDPSYTTRFPGQIRLLRGSLDGMLLGQQTAANLHVGDQVVAIGDALALRAASPAPRDRFRARSFMKPNRHRITHPG